MDPRLTFSSKKRSGDTLESGPTKERKKEEGPPSGGENANAPNGLTQAYGPCSGLTMEDYGLSVSDEDAIRLALGPQDLLNATDFPMAGWPSYQELYRCGPPVPAAYEASQIAGLEGVGPRTTCNRVAGRGIVSRAWRQRARSVWMRRNGR